MRVRLRDMPTAAELAAMYAEPHDHRGYGYGHGLRVDASISLARYAVYGLDRPVIADLSCGNGVVADQARNGRLATMLLGDFAPGWDFHGPIEQTLGQLGDRLHGLDIDLVDLFILGETIEHLDDPDAVLRDIRRVSRQLLLSTPIGETDQGNPEHLWGWDVDGVADMLHAAGWDTRNARKILVDLPDTYSYQVWLTR